MITSVFDKHDTNLYATWHMEDGGVVCVVIPDVGELRMTLAKAEELSADIAAKAEYGRFSAKNLEVK